VYGLSWMVYVSICVFCYRDLDGSLESAAAAAASFEPSSSL
jgi:hypothetical protein